MGSLPVHCPMTETVVFDKPEGPPSCNSKLSFLDEAFAIIPKTLNGIFEIPMFKVYQSQWIPPISIDPDVDSTYSIFCGVFPVPLGIYRHSMRPAVTAAPGTQWRLNSVLSE